MLIGALSPQKMAKVFCRDITPCSLVHQGLIANVLTIVEFLMSTNLDNYHRGHAREDCLLVKLVGFCWPVILSKALFGMQFRIID